MQPDTFRWLLTALSAPAFVRLYVEPHERGNREAERWALRLYEAAFFSLTYQRSHPPQGQKDTRKEAWKVLERAIVSDSVRQEFLCQLRQEAAHKSIAMDRFDAQLAPPEFFAVVWRLLLSAWEKSTENRREYRELASCAGVLDLFLEASRGVRQRTNKQTNYVEIHAHLEGSVPYDWLWEQWMTQDSIRVAAQIDYPIEQRERHPQAGMGRWSTTYSALLQIAADCRRSLFKSLVSTARDGASLQSELLGHIGREHSPLSQTVAYLAIYIGIRRSMIFGRSVSGLAQFTSFYGKPKVLRRKLLRREQVKETMRRFCQDEAIGVELRTTLGDKVESIRDTLDDLVAGYFDYLKSLDPLPATVPRFGIILSLDKNPDLKESVQLSDGKFWENQARAWDSQVEKLLKLLDENLLYRYFVVGIDAAGQEQGCPPRALWLSIKRVHDYNRKKGVKRQPSGRAMSQVDLTAMLRSYRQQDAGLGAVQNLLKRKRPASIRLGITIHAGEDFVDPMTGLRHIWETIECLRLRNGDRIGHALAAGLDREAVIELLNRRTSQDNEKPREHRWRIHKPRGVHLLDLAWEWKMRESQVKRSAQKAKLKQTLAGEMLRSVGHSSLGTPVNSERLFGALEEAKEHPVRLLLPAVHFKDPKYIDPEDREWVILDEAWLERFEELRAMVIQKLKTNKISIESCPTSNQRIGNLKEPPLKELLRKLPEQTLIATDDPGLFDAWPQHELAKFSTEERARLLANNRRHSFLRFEG